MCCRQDFELIGDVYNGKSKENVKNWRMKYRDVSGCSRILKEEKFN